MESNTLQSGFARLSPGAARGVLLGVVVACAVLVGITLSPLASGYADGPARGPSDVLLYRAEINRIRAGEPYYQAAAAELRTRGYPMRSVFNWRTPLPMALLGRFESPLPAKMLLAVAALGLLLAGYTLLRREAGLFAACLGVLLLIGALLPCVLGDLLVMSEVWTGLLLGLAMVLAGLGWRGLGVAAGIAALFFRELALPYCLLAAVIAWREGRRRELAGWCAGLAAYAVFFAWHAGHVLALMHLGEIAHPHGWIRGGGAAFVISTVQMNCYLLLLPQWASALYLVAALGGAAGWKSPAGERLALTLALYVLGFGIVGQDFNQYWGAIAAPWFCLAAAFAPVALRDLARSAFRTPEMAMGRS